MFCKSRIALEPVGAKHLQSLAAATLLWAWPKLGRVLVASEPWKSTHPAENRPEQGMSFVAVLTKPQS